MRTNNLNFWFLTILCGIFFLSPTQTSAQTCTASPSGIAAWLPGDGNALDISGNSNHGTLLNGATFAVGKVGQGFLIDDVDDVLRINASPSLDVGAGGGFTLEAWINPNDNKTNPIVEYFNSQTSVVGVHFFTGVGADVIGNNLFANIIDTGGNHIIESNTGIVTPGAFQHVALSYDKTTGVATIYRNGVVVVQQNLGVFTPRTNSDLLIGARLIPNFPRFDASGDSSNRRRRQRGQMQAADNFHRQYDERHGRRRVQHDALQFARSHHCRQRQFRYYIAESNRVQHSGRGRADYYTDNGSADRHRPGGH